MQDESSAIKTEKRRREEEEEDEEETEDESDKEERWKWGGARRQSTCVQSRKVCSPSSSDRQTGLSGEFIFTSI